MGHLCFFFVTAMSFTPGAPRLDYRVSWTGQGCSAWSLHISTGVGESTVTLRWCNVHVSSDDCLFSPRHEFAHILMSSVDAGGAYTANERISFTKLIEFISIYITSVSLDLLVSTVGDAAGFSWPGGLFLQLACCGRSFRCSNFPDRSVSFLIVWSLIVRWCSSRLGEQTLQVWLFVLTPIEVPISCLQRFRI